MTLIYRTYMEEFGMEYKKSDERSYIRVNSIIKKGV
jgi:hypothetical protein